MARLTPEQIAAVKGKGFLLNRGTNCFSGRIVPVGTVFTADQLAAIAEIARLYGNGKAFATSRLSIEIPGIPFDRIDDAMRYAEEHGITCK